MGDKSYFIWELSLIKMVDRNLVLNDFEEGDFLLGSDECKKLVEEDIFVFFRWLKSICVYEIYCNVYIKISILKMKFFEIFWRFMLDGIRKFELYSVCLFLSKELKKEGKS